MTNMQKRCKIFLFQHLELIVQLSERAFDCTTCLRHTHTLREEVFKSSYAMALEEETQATSLNL